MREGLPARFRMRHTPHYVDELLGDAPLRTVREIPISEIESPVDDHAELEDLERSIRRLGVIEPLLVGRRGASYRVIAGMRRLRAAQRVGLDTVPCLVHDVDEDRLTDLRDAAMQRVTIPPPPAEPVAEVATARTCACSPAIGEAALGLEFVTALLPAMNAAGNDRLRWGVLTDLAAVELSHARVASPRRRNPHASGAHRSSIGRSPRARQRCGFAVAIEARLRGVRVDVSLPGTTPIAASSSTATRAAMPSPACCRVCSRWRREAGQCSRSRADHEHPAGVDRRVPSRRIDPELGPEALRGSSMLAGVSIRAGRMARRSWPHSRNRTRARRPRRRQAGGKGCLVTFVVPRVEG